MRKHLILFWGICLALPVSATEVDNFQPHLIKQRDVLTELDALTNYRLQEAEKAANAQGHGCNHVVMRQAVWNTLGAQMVWGHLENDVERLDKVFDKIHIPVEQSIYKNLHASESFFVWGIVNLVIDIASTIRVGNYRIGSDKLGHFFAQGADLFSVAYSQNQGIEEALKLAISQERGYYGSFVSGVYSYGDVSADFAGMIFWSKITPQYAKQGPFSGPPYFTCINGAWKQTQKFTWAGIINGSWDEAVNCSAFRDKNIHDKVYLTIDQIAEVYRQKTGKTVNLHCPILPEQCLEAVQSAKQFAPYLIHPKCIAAAKSLYHG